MRPLGGGKVEVADTATHYTDVWKRAVLTAGWGLVKSNAAELQTEGVKLLQGGSCRGLRVVADAVTVTGTSLPVNFPLRTMTSVLTFLFPDILPNLLPHDTLMPTLSCARQCRDLLGIPKPPPRMLLLHRRRLLQAAELHLRAQVQRCVLPPNHKN